MIKLFLVLWFPPHGSLGRKDVLGGILIVLEIVFKIFGLFIVKEFIDDLKSTLNLYPTPQYYCIYTSNSPPPPITILPSPAGTGTDATNKTATMNPSSPSYPFVSPIYQPTTTTNSAAEPISKPQDSNKTSDVILV